MRLLYIIIFLLITIIVLNCFFDLIQKEGSLNYICQNEKNNRLPEKGLLSDKIKVKKYIQENFPDVKTSKIIHVIDDPEELRKIKLPENFVLKCSTGARMFHIVKSGKYSVEDLIKKSKYFLSINFSDYGYRSIPFLYLKEPHYNHTNKRILIEEYIDNIIEFRIMLVDGKIIYYEKEGLQFNNELFETDIYNSMKTKNTKLEKNITIEKIQKFCNDFYKKEKFKLTRLDFYINKDTNDFYFGEITFTPENCRHKYSDNFDNYFKNHNIW